jgi:hypothetical protein
MTEILWRRLDTPGHEAARLIDLDQGWRLEGSAVFLHESQPCSLSYRIDCDDAWQTRSASVIGFVGRREINIDIGVDHDLCWWMNGVEAKIVAGCIDVDLNFSPSTNLLPIRRLDLNVGDEAVVRAAWLRFPSFRLEVLEQTYRRTSHARYQYTSGSFEAEITVNDAGLATEYAGVWVAEV